MGDTYLGTHDLVSSHRFKQPAVLEDSRHLRRALIHWRAVKTAYEDPRVRRLNASDAVGANVAGGIDIGGGRAELGSVETDKVSLITELLSSVWSWAAFEMVKNNDDPPEQWRWRVYCTAIANPGPGKSIPRLARGSVYLLLEPTPVRPELASYQAFEVSWTRKKGTLARRRALAADSWSGRFLQNEDLQRRGDA